ncbi:MAG TPA: nucleotide disphospho-sugar-binding domain-containing protein [Ktedonobacterales bacterium]|nr:nucleotide disphospho-sugar-binding domain-containing protein [Ktedonobacterales bacterium]
MSDLLIVTWDGGGNVAPALGIAAELMRRQHTVRVLGHPQQRAHIEAAGCAFLPFEHAHPWSPLDPVPGLRGATRQLTQVFTDRGIGEDMLAAAQAHHPDLVVIDHLLFGALRAAERAGLRHATLVHTLYSQQAQLWSGGVPALLTGLRGMRPVKLWRRSCAVLITTLPLIDRCGNLPDHVHFTGPVWPEPKPRPAASDAGDPLVLVSLSTLYQEGQQRALQAILDALAVLPVRALVTTGLSVDPSVLRAPANAQVERVVPHTQIMPHAALMVGHGGHGTTMLALAHDLPLVILPMFELGDQPVVGRTVEQLGAARVLRKTAPAAAIRAAIEQLLPDGPHREAARVLGAQLRHCDGAVAGADALERALTPSPVRAR